MKACPQTVRPRSPRRRCRGFTLLEIVAATTLFAVIAAALVSVFMVTLRLQQKADARLTRSNPSQYALDLMRRDLLNLVPPGDQLAGSVVGENLGTEGAYQDRLQFCRTLSGRGGPEPWGDVRAIVYELQAASGNPQSRALVRSVTRNLLASVAETPQEQVLLTDVTSFRVTYYDGQEWRDSWDSTVEESILPEAVQIRIELARAADGYPRPPVELLVPVAVKPWPTPAATGSGSPSQAEVAVEPRNRSG